MRKQLKRLRERLGDLLEPGNRSEQVPVTSPRRAVCATCEKMANAERDDVPSAFGITFGRN